MSLYRALILTTTMLILIPIAGAFGQGSPNVTLLDQVDDYGSYNDCWGYTAPDGREYALLGISNGTSIIDITDSGNATEITFIPGLSSSHRDIKTFQDFAYVVNESGGGMHIINLTDLPNSANLANTYTGFQTSHNIYIDEPNAMLYAEGSGSQPVRAISLADPLNPVQLSTFGISSHDVYARDNIVYVSEGNNRSIGIFDLSQPANPTLVSRFQVPNGGFVHNAWLSDDGNFLMTTEETTGRTVKHFNIGQSLSNPPIAGEYLGPSNLAHNTHIMGDFAYISHYADGLHIVDISDPNNLVEAGFYDTSTSGGGFNGAWGAFPFFPSGKILISDIQNGLYVVDFDETQPSVVSLTATPQNPPVTIPPQGAFFDFDVSIQNNTEQPQTVQYWNTVTLPIGEQIGPQLGPFTVTVPAGEGFSTTLTMEVPNRPPPATYGFNIKVGDFNDRVIDIDSFNFTKTPGPNPGTAAVHSADNWVTKDSDAESPRLDGEIPDGYALDQNYPNPFNPTTTIAYQLPNSGQVKIAIYDLLGRQVRELVNGVKDAGIHRVEWNGTDQSGHQVTSGVYVYQLQSGDFIQTRKLILMK